MTLPLEKITLTGRAFAAASISPPSENGNRQIAIPMEVTQGDHAGETITWISVFHNTPDKNGRTGYGQIIESLQTMGWSGDEIAELVDIDDARVLELLPNEVAMVCEPDTFDGKTRLKIKWINRVGGGRFAFKEALSGNDLKQFSSQLKGTIRNMNGPKKAAGVASSNGTQRQPHPNAPGAKRDDDLPF